MSSITEKLHAKPVKVSVTEKPAVKSAHPKMDVSLAERTKILTLSQYTSKTQRQIAKIVGVNCSTVCRIVKKYRNSKNLSTNRKDQCGRKRKLTPDALKLLVDESVKSPRKDSLELKRNLESHAIFVSPRTVRRHLFNSGRIARRPVKKQFLTEKMKQQRLAWAHTYASWTKEDWRQVMFTDESQFCVQGQRSQYVRRSRKEEITVAHMDQYQKHPQKRMYWGCMTYHGVGSISPIYGNMNALKYMELLTVKLQDDFNEAFPTGTGIYQHDLAPCHRAKKVKKLFLANGVRVLDWPGNSPDLTPIENLWAIMKRELQKSDCSTLEKLNQAILDMWYDDTKLNQHCANLIDSMPQRVSKLIQKGGGHIKY